MIEQTYIRGTSGQLVATLTPPSMPAAGGPAPTALLTNSRVISRVGPHPTTVYFARRLAAKSLDTRVLPALAPRQVGSAMATATATAPATTTESA